MECFLHPLSTSDSIQQNFNVKKKQQQQLHLCMHVMYTLHYNTYVMKSEVNKFNSLSQNGTDPLL